MKTFSFNIKQSIFFIAITGFMATFSAPVFANNKKEPANISASNQPTISYVNSDESGSIFKVNFDTGTKVKFELKVQDSNGDVLFKDIYESDKFSKYVKVLNEAYDVSSLSFAIRVIPTGQVHHFEVSSNTMLVKDVVITKQ